MLIPNQDFELVQIQQQPHTLRQSTRETETVLEQAIDAEYIVCQGDEQFRLLINDIPDYAIFMLDTQGSIISWNMGTQLIQGYTAAEIIGHHFSEFYLPADIAAQKPQYALRIASIQGIYKEEGWQLRKDGSAFWADIVITALFDEVGSLRGFSEINHDLTKQKEAEAAQRQLHQLQLQLRFEQAARKQTEAHMRLRDTFLSAAAHEFRTPITVLSGCVQLLQRRMARELLSPENLEKSLHIITAQVKRLERLASMILSSTRLEFGIHSAEYTVIDLREITEQIIEELQFLSSTQRIVLNFPSSPLLIQGNGLQIEQAIYNLIHNAIKYSPSSGKIAVTAHHQSEQVVITVCDEGRGIPANDLPHIFDRFYRANNSQQATHTSLGIGLYLVKEFVAMQQGRVEVESVVGQGTTFRMIFPFMQEGSKRS